MANLKFTIAAIALHISLGGLLFAATTPETIEPADNLLTKTEFPKQGAFFAFYEYGAEAVIDGTKHNLNCTPYKNELCEWEAWVTPTGDFIKIGENGTTTAKINGKYMTFLPE